MRYLLCLSLWGFLPFWLQAQNKCDLTLQGKVTDEHDSTVLAYADISIIELNIHTVANEKGEYFIKNLCKGNYIIRCVYVGTDTIFKTISLSQSSSLNFFPEKHTQLLNEVKIKAEKHQILDAAVHQHLEAEDLFKNSGKPIGKIAEEVMGVNALSTGNNIAKPIINGLHSNRVITFNNEVRHESQQWGAEHGPEIDPFIAEEITIIKGANAVRYGSDAIGGVLLIEPKTLKYDSLIRGELNFGGMSNGRQGVASAMAEGGFKKIKGFSWRAQGSYKRGGNQKTPSYYLANTGVSEHNFSLTANYQKKKFFSEVYYSQFNTNIAIFLGSHIGNVTDLLKAYEAEKPSVSANFNYEIQRPYQHLEHELFKVKSTYQLNSTNHLRVMYARQYNLRQEFDNHSDNPSIQLEITTHIAQASWERKTKNLNLSTGIEGISRENTYEYSYFIPAFKNYNGALFYIAQYFSKKWIAEAGIRYDKTWQQAFLPKKEQAIFQYEGLSGNAAFTYKFTPKLSSVFNAGYAWRAPGINELFSNGIHHGAASLEIGDKNLEREKSLQFLLSVKYENKALTLEAEGYQNYINDFIYLSPSPIPTLTIKGAFPTFYYKQCDASLSGINWMSSYTISSIKLKSKGSFLWAWNKNAQDYIVQMPSNRLTWAAEYKWKKNTFEINMKNVMKQTRIPANTEPVAAPKAYNLFGFQYNTFIQKIQLAVEIDNLFNTKYRDYLNRFRYFTDEVGTTINLRIKIPIEKSNQVNH